MLHNNKNDIITLNVNVIILVINIVWNINIPLNVNIS